MMWGDCPLLLHQTMNLCLCPSILFVTLYGQSCQVAKDIESVMTYCNPLNGLVQPFISGCFPQPLTQQLAIDSLKKLGSDMLELASLFLRPSSKTVSGVRTYLLGADLLIGYALESFGHSNPSGCL